MKRRVSKGAGFSQNVSSMPKKSHAEKMKNKTHVEKDAKLGALSTCNWDKEL